jgi:anti-sigma-K factor RskA
MNISEYISSGIIESYVMGLATEDETAELRQLIKTEPAIKEAVTAFELAFERQVLAAASKVPFAETENKIFNKVGIIPEGNNTAKPGKVVRLNWFKVTAVAASALLCVSAYFNYSLNKQNQAQAALLAVTDKIEVAKNNSLPVGDFKVMQKPTITPVALYGVSYHAICRCTMFWDKEAGRAYVMLHHLPNSSETNDYQLWAMVNNKPVSLGILNDTVRDRFIEFTNVPKDATTFKVTLEKAGGSQVPNEDTYLKGTVI